MSRTFLKVLNGIKGTPLRPQDLEVCGQFPQTCPGQLPFIGNSYLTPANSLTALNSLFFSEFDIGSKPEAEANLFSLLFLRSLR
jgi:hypothetical protein